jgi:hypothetical protein
MLYEAKEAAAQTVSFYVALNTNQKVRKILRIARPQSLQDVFKAGA